MAKKIEPKDLGIHSTPAGFNIPKIKKIKSTAVLNYVAPSDREFQNLIREADRTCLDPDLKIRKQWNLNTVHMVSPASTVETRYREKRAEMKEQGGSRLQQEVFGFYTCRDRNLAADIARTGIKTNPYVKGGLGDPSQGVYLFRYLDVALLSQREYKSTYILVFKVLQGRAKPVQVTDIGAVRNSMKEPTPNFDCHVSQSAPRSEESVFVMCNKSQMYIYEYTEDAVPAEFPRQCLPYSLMEFSSTGDVRTDGGTSAICPKGISTSAANAGWASAARRLSAESGRKAGPEPGQYSKDYSGFAFPAVQPMSFPTPPSMPSDADALGSSKGKESYPSVLGGPALSSEGGTWWAPLENCNHNPSVAVELSSTQSDKPSAVHEVVQPHQTMGLNFEGANDLPLPGDGRFEHEVFAAASGTNDQFRQGSLSVSTSAQRDPRRQRLFVNSPGTNIPVPSPTSSAGVGEQQTSAVVQNVTSPVYGLWMRRNSTPETTLFHPQVESNPSDSLGLTWSGSNHQRDCSELPSWVPSFSRQNQSVLHPSNSAMNMRFPQQERNSDNTLPEQGSERVPMPESESNLNVNKAPHIPCLDRTPAKSALKKPTVEWPSPSQADSGKKKKTLSFQDYLKKKKAQAQANSEVKDMGMSLSIYKTVNNSVTGSSEPPTHAKQSLGSQKEEFQGCDYHPPEMSEQNEFSVRSADMDSCVPVADTVTDVCEQMSKAGRNSSENPKPVRRDPRLHSSYISSVHSQKIVTNEPNKNSRMVSRPDEAAFQGCSIEDTNKSRSTTVSSLKLLSGSQGIPDMTQPSSEQQKESNMEYVEQKSTSELMDISNHQVLFADLEETETENALSVSLDDIFLSEHSPEGGEDGTCPAVESEQTDLDDPAVTIKEVGQDVIGDGVEKGHSNLPGVSEVHWSSDSENVSVKQPVCDQELSLSANEPLSEQMTSVIRSEVVNQLPDIVTGLKKRFALVTAQNFRGKNLLPCREVENTAEAPGPDSFCMKSSNTSSASESALWASEHSSSSKEITHDFTSDDLALNSSDHTRTGKMPKLADGKKQKGRGKITQTDVSESVDYAMIRLAKGLRPGKSIHVGGLGKNPTDDPLPVLEGKRRGKKRNLEIQKDLQKASKLRVENEMTSPQQCQTAGRKSRKKRRTTFGTVKKKAKKKRPDPVCTSPPNDDDIDYTDFQFDQPQEFCVSICDDSVVTGGSAMDCPAPDTVVTVEPPEGSMTGDEGRVPCPVTEIKPGTEASPSDWGKALPLSTLGLLHWTEALLQPSLNPQVVLEYLKEHKGHADLDNCPIDQMTIKEEEQTVDFEMTLAVGGTNAHDSGNSSARQNDTIRPTLSESGSESEGEEKSTGNENRLLASEQTELPETGEGESREHDERNLTQKETESEKEDGNTQPTPELVLTNISSSAVNNARMEPVSSVACDLAVESIMLANDHFSTMTTQKTEEKTQTASSPNRAGWKNEMFSKETDACSDTGKTVQNLKTLPSVGPSLLSSGDRSTSFPKSQSPFAQPVTRVAHPRPAFTVCSQGSTKQNWQRWKSNQAQQMQLKTTKDSDDSSQKQPSASCVESDKVQGISRSHHDADTEGNLERQNYCMKNNQENNDHRHHVSSDAQKFTSAGSSTSVQNRQGRFWQDSGFWLGINELTSLHQLDEDSMKDKTDVYSRAASKISPRKLSQLVPGKAPSLNTSPPCFLEVTSVDTALQSCIVNNDVGSSVNSTVSDASESVKIKSPESCAILEQKNKKIGSNPSPSPEAVEKPVTSDGQNIVKTDFSGSHITSARKVCEEIKENPSTNFCTQTEQLKQASGSSKQISSESLQSVVPQETKTDFFDIVKVGCNSTGQHYGSIPGLDLLSPPKPEEATSTHISVDDDSENVDVLSAGSKQSKKVCDVVESQEEEVTNTFQDTVKPKMRAESRETDKKYGKAKQAGNKSSTKTPQNDDLNIPSCSSSAFFNEELDIVGTPGTSNQIQNISEKKKKLFSFVFQSPEQKKNAFKERERYTDDEESSSDDLQIIEKDDRKAVERNALEVDDEKNKKDKRVSGCPIPCFTSARSYQKDDRKDMKKQLDVSKRSSAENLRNVGDTIYCQNTRPAFQTEVYIQPPPPGADEDNGSKTTHLGQFCQNPPPMFHSDRTYGIPVHQQTLDVNRLLVPGVSMPMPNMLMPNVRGPSVTVPVSVHPSNPLLISEPGRSMSADNGQRIAYVQPMISSLFTTPPPLLAPVSAPSLQLADHRTEVSSVTSTSQNFNASNQVYVSVADSSHDSFAALQTMAPPVTSTTSRLAVETHDAVEGSRGHLVKTSEMDVITWFAQREAAGKNPQKKDVIHWFSDIIDIPPETKKARLDFIELLSHKKSNMYESKEKVSDFSSRNSRKTSPSESRDAGNKECLKRRSSSQDTSGSKKPKIDMSRVSFKVGLSSDGVSKRRGPLVKSVVLDSQSDSEDSDQNSIDQISRSDSVVCSKIAMDIKKDSRAHDADKAPKRKEAPIHDTDKAHLESQPYIGKQTCIAGENLASSSERRKRSHSRWDQPDRVSKKSSTLHGISSQNNDTEDDDDMNDYAHALLEGDLTVKSLETITNSISDSILRSVSEPKSSKTSDDKLSTQQKSSVFPDKTSCGQKEPKSGKSKASLTDKPLEFLLFAKEMIMQKLQEEEKTEQVDTESEVDTDIHPQNDPASKETRFSKLDVNSSQQMTSEIFGSDLEHMKTKKEESQDLSRKDPANVVESCPVLHAPSSEPSSSIAEEVGEEKGTVRQSSASADTDGVISTSCSSQENAERMATSARISSETQKTEESSPSPFTVDSSGVSAVTEEEINRLKDIVCQLTCLPVTKPSEKSVSLFSTSAKRDTSSATSVLSTSANRDKSGPSISGNDSKVESSYLQVKNVERDEPRTQESGPKRSSSSAGWDWSLFLTSRPSQRKFLQSSSKRRNYYGDIIDPPMISSEYESTQRQFFQKSTGESRSATKLSSQTESITDTFTSLDRPVQTELRENPKVLDRTDSAHFYHVYTDDKSADGQSVPMNENSYVSPKTCATKAKNSVQVLDLQVSSRDKMKQSAKQERDTVTLTDDSKTPHLNLVLPSDLEVTSPKQKVESSATLQHTTSAHMEMGSAESRRSSSPTSTAPDSHHATKSKCTLHGNPETKTLKDFLHENFPDEDPVSLVDVLDYRLTADVNTMSSKMMKNILCKIRRHLQHIHPVCTSQASTSLSPAPPKLLLEEFPVDQIELELDLVEGCLRLLQATRAIQVMPDKAETGSGGKSSRDGLPKESAVGVKDALSMVVQDFNNAIKEALRGWRGRPHQGMPTELLLRDEQDQLYTREDVFTILLVTIPSKPFARLLQFKEDIEKCLIKKNKASLTNKTFVLLQERRRIEQLQKQRRQIMKTFTGAVSANRLRKVTMIRDHYAASQCHLLQVLGDGSVAKMNFFRATYEAIQNHLQILENEMK